MYKVTLISILTSITSFNSYIYYSFIFKKGDCRNYFLFGLNIAEAENFASYCNCSTCSAVCARWKREKIKIKSLFPFIFKITDLLSIFPLSRSNFLPFHIVLSIPSIYLSIYKVSLYVISLSTVYIRLR